MEDIIREGWKTGNYQSLSDDIVDRLKELQKDYELVIKPHVLIGGKDPYPGMLFVKKIRGQYDLNDCIYIDNKYFHEVGFTPAQQKITQTFKDKLSEAVVIIKDRAITDIDGNIIANAGDKLKILEKEVFTIKKRSYIRCKTKTMAMKNNIEKIIEQKLSKLLIDYTKEEDFAYIYSNNYIHHNVFLTIKNIGGKFLLNISALIKIIHIENNWTRYISELGLSPEPERYSFYNTLNYVDSSCYPKISPIGIPLEDNENWIIEFLEWVINGHYLPFFEKVKDIRFCDSIINKDIEITDEVRKISPMDGLPFRKIFIAEEAGNPNLVEIKKAMRKHVEEDYIAGKEHNFEKLCKIKPVFEKLFGTSDEV